MRKIYCLAAALLLCLPALSFGQVGGDLPRPAPPNWRELGGQAREQADCTEECAVTASVSVAAATASATSCSTGGRLRLLRRVAAALPRPAQLPVIRHLPVLRFPRRCG